MINCITLTGRLVKDPEEKTYEGGTLSRFTIANETGFGDRKNVNYISVVAFGKNGEFVRKYFAQGSDIGIVGELRMQKYTDKDGKSRQSFDVIAEHITFVGRKQNSDDQQTPASASDLYDGLPY